MELITSVEKERGRITVRLDNGTVYNITRAIYEERPLTEGELIDPEAYEKWLLPRQYRSALKKAVEMLSVRACSCNEIRQKLLRIGYMEETADMAVLKLRQQNLLNDAEFARQWVQSRGSRYGSYRIRQELKLKGVDEDCIDEALAGLDTDEQNTLAVQLVRKGLREAPAGEDPRKTSQRILGRLVRKGISFETAKEALESVRREEDDEEY